MELLLPFDFPTGISVYMASSPTSHCHHFRLQVIGGEVINSDTLPYDVNMLRQVLPLSLRNQQDWQKIFGC